MSDVVANVRSKQRREQALRSDESTRSAGTSLVTHTDSDESEDRNTLQEEGEDKDEGADKDVAEERRGS